VINGETRTQTRQDRIHRTIELLKQGKREHRDLQPIGVSIPALAA
jgi:hypothetical protein